jgi:hypothetical protein
MQTSFSELEYESKKKQTRRDRFLSEIEAATPWSSLTNVIAPFYPASGKAGRPPIGLERMLRMYVVQQCFGFSDEGVEDAVYDSQAIRRFVGIDLNREGVTLSLSTLAEWVGRVGVALQPLLDRLILHLLQGRVLHADETPVVQLDHRINLKGESMRKKLNSLTQVEQLS